MINSRDSVTDNFNERMYKIPFDIGAFVKNNDTNELFKVIEYIINNKGFSARILHIEKENISGAGPFKVIDMKNKGEEISISINELTQNYAKSAFSYIVPISTINNQREGKGISFTKK